jgi:diguanylate cyclase (GGDEF)-like protein
VLCRELDRISAAVRLNVERHEVSLSQFKSQLGKLGESDDAASIAKLCRIADDLLRPTMQLANQLAQCHSELQMQSGKLMTFTDVRTDALTSLRNRRALEEALAAQFAVQSRYGHVFSLAVFDIDHFKTVNDTQGHLAGDSVLKQVAQIMENSIREIDLLVRYGGEEFVLLMPMTDLEGATRLSERLRAKVADGASVTVSGGVAMAIDGETESSLLNRADSAMYHAKEAGRNQICVHVGSGIRPLSAMANNGSTNSTVVSCSA